MVIEKTSRRRNLSIYYKIRLNIKYFVCLKFVLFIQIYFSKDLLYFTISRPKPKVYNVRINESKQKT